MSPAYRVNEFIKELGLTKNEFARRIGISSALISKITNQETNFGVEVLVKIVTAFPNVDIYKILGVENALTEILQSDLEGIRDGFAGAAMSALIRFKHAPEQEGSEAITISMIAEDSYRYADAMLKARKNKVEDALEFKELVHKVRRTDELIKALKKAKSLIEHWHNFPMNGSPQEMVDDLWNIYDKNAPEMKLINEVLAKYGEEVDHA